MTRLNNISQHIILRMALCLVLLLGVSLNLAAQTGWDGQKMSKPIGSGTTDDPYIIASAENLYYLSRNVGVKDTDDATFGTKVYVQTADIDLNGQDWAPIGYSGAVFTGSYDGQGHTISGLYVDWGGYQFIASVATSKTTSTGHYSYGLFGVFSGTLKNLVIDGARIEQKTLGLTTGSELDKRIAVVAGNVVVSQDVTIENIIVRNSEIVGCGNVDNQQKATAYMIGGIIGDIHAGAVNTGSDAFAGKAVKISNIYSEVDVSLPYTALYPSRSANKGHQFYFGGIVGRARSNYLVQMPKNVIYKGEVNAPLAIVGPVFSEARTSADTKNFEGNKLGYAGDLSDKTNGKAKTSDYTNINYYDYKVWNYSDDSNPPTSATEIDIDNLAHNETIAGNNLDTYTFTAQGTTTGTISLTAATPQQMSMFQGVNRGAAITSQTDFKDKAEALAINGFNWDFAGSNRNMSRENVVTMSIDKPDIATYKVTYTAPPATSPEGYTVKWYALNTDGKTTDHLDDTDETHAPYDGRLEIKRLTRFDLVAVLYDGDKAIESCIARNSFSATLTNNFPEPYDYAVSYGDCKGNQIDGIATMKVEVYNSTNLKKTWTTTENSYTQSIGLTFYQPTVKVTISPNNPTEIDGEITKELKGTNWLKLVRTYTASDDRRLPYELGLSITDNSDNPLTFDNVRYRWFLTSPAVELYNDVSSSNITLTEPVKVTNHDRTYRINISHEKFLVEDVPYESTYSNSGSKMAKYLVTANDEAKGLVGPKMTNVSTAGSDKLTVAAEFFDDKGVRPSELYRLATTWTLLGESNKDITETVDHSMQWNSTDGIWYLEFPYPYLGALTFKLKMDDVFGMSRTTTFNDFSLQTVPTLEADATNPKKVNLILKAGNKELDFFTDLTFDWKFTDTQGNAQDGLIVDATGRSVTVNNFTSFDRKILCTLTDHYGNKTTVEYTVVANPEVSFEQDALDSYKYNVVVDGGAIGTYNVTSWEMFDADGNSIDFSHLTKTTGTSDVHIIIDETFFPRTLVANYTYSNGTEEINGKMFLDIPAALTSYEIHGDNFPYIAYINGEDASTRTWQTERWDIVYDDGGTETVDGSVLNGLTRPSTNARYTLVITDHYGEWKEAMRKVYDTRTITVKREGDNLIATINGTGSTEGTWVWRGISGDISGDITKGYVLETDNVPTTGNVQVINATNNNYDVYSAVWTSADGTVVLVGFLSNKNVVYVFNKESSKTYKNGKYLTMARQYPAGDDQNDGRTPYTAVRTMTRAYNLLASDTSAVNNIVVVMGYLNDSIYLAQEYKDGGYMPKAIYKKNATITGSYGEVSNEGTLRMIGDGGSGCRGFNGATILKDITLSGLNTNGNPDQLFLYCNLNDLTISTNVKVEDYAKMETTNGLLGDANAPRITIVGAFHQYANLRPLEYPSGNAVPGQTTIIIQSGNWGRIIASGRTNGLNNNSNNVFAHPDTPHRVVVNMAVKHSKNPDGTENKHDYTPGKEYDYDVGMLVGGQTDGTVYVDAKLYMSSGTVGRFVSGNISYGRATGDGFPTDGFFGSTELTLDGGDIMELVGGTLGRHDCHPTNPTATNKPTEKCEAYFYGRSILNINGGIIHDNVYGAGAGGVTGIGTDDTEGNHTKDLNIPYYTGATDAYGRKVVAYGPYMDEDDNYVAKGKMPKMSLSDGSTLDLADSYCIVNVNGGTIEGDVYGGGYGFSKDIAVDKALDQAGDLFGHSYVNINGGTVKGNVYGGGAGASQYYIAAAEADKPQFADLANIYGDTHVSITGGTVEGKVFAGSKGIEGFPNMATIIGNTGLEIKNVKLADNTDRIPVINDNIYGGSELGRIEGSTFVTINGGAIGNCIFGGSEGIATVRDAENVVTTPGTTAYITGSTTLNILGGQYFTAAEHNSISEDNRIAVSSRTFNIYGGGYNNCVIEGNTNVNVKQSLLVSHNNLLEGRKFEECVADETYRKFSLYGAGRGELTDVKGDANITVNIEIGASVPATRPVDVANRQQFFMIAGGGMAGHVWGNTNVNLDGNVFARRIYGGGMYGNVLGDVNMTVRRGSYHGVFGGGLLGNIRGNANLQIGTRVGETLLDGSEATAEGARIANNNLYIYDNVYGGNDVSGCTGYETTNLLWNDGDIQNINGLDGEINFFTEDADFTMTADNAKHHYLFEHWDKMGYPGKPYYRHLIRASLDKGVNMKICGGKILGDVFGAGNGNHTGYYVPNNAKSEHYSDPSKITRMMFHEGLPYHYRVNKRDKNSYKSEGLQYNTTTNAYTGTLLSVLDPNIREHYGLYEYRPRVGKVVMHIGGNSADDRVEIGGDVYGGGLACTIGRFDPNKDVLTDPSRFLGGGMLKMNFGSHVTVKDGVYMGSRGRIIGEQTVLSDNAEDYEGTLNSDYDYHYYDRNTDTYKLGFPNTVEGRNRFHAYMKLIDMDATTELTFYDQTDNTESIDVRWGSFYAGGARGSMTYEPKEVDPNTGKLPVAYEYTLPAGLTVETRVVGGSEDAQVVFYEYAPDFKSFDTTKPIFTYDGGIVYDTNTGKNGHYGGGVVHWNGYDLSSDSTKTEADKEIGVETPRGSRTVMKLTVKCQFDPQEAVANNVNWDTYKDIEADEANGIAKYDGEVEKDAAPVYYGGLVYGGCYNSGITNGSVEVECTNTLLGSTHFESEDFRDYLSWSSLRRNVGRVYGGGFGEKTSIWGNTKVTLSNNARAFNVFGGGMMGDVMGGTEIYVRDYSLVYNAVYGGGMRADVGLPSYRQSLKDAGLYAKGTHVNVISGGIDRLYGGAFMSDVYGGTHITISDALAVDEAEAVGTSPVRLMVGTVYGGNDVSGNIYPDENAKLADNTDNPAFGLDTYVYMTEKASAQKTAENRYYMAQPSKVAGESGKNYAGYPMVGTIYGAGNGDMSDYIKGVTIDREEDCYASGKIHIANGHGADYEVFDMKTERLSLPNVNNAKIDISGGTIINVYAGGSMCTTRESNDVTIHYNDTTARAAFLTTQNDQMTWGLLRLFESLQKEEVTSQSGDYTYFSYQIYRVFGGNNLMDMDIQPTLSLQKGNIFSVYSGGNFGKMTYCKDNFAGVDASKPRGLALTIDSPNIRIASIYGGGRVGDIHAMKRTETVVDGKKRYSYSEPATPFSDSEYGATLNIMAGIIGDVYGGNNVAGTVYNGTNVNINGAVSGNVYGSGNGNYIYYYDHDNTKGHATMITEGYNEAFGGRYFILPKKVAYNNGATPVYYGDSDEEKILAINSYRPNVEKAYLNIQGTDTTRVYVLGSVYCGGNSSTILFDPDPAKNEGKGNIKFEIGDYVALGGVFLGSNGEGLANGYNITYMMNLNGIDDMGKPNEIASLPDFQFTTPAALAASPLHFNDKAYYQTDLYPNLLSMYMRAAEVTALPTEFKLAENNAQNAYIGNFCLGGNYGSMMTDQSIELTLPKNLTIFGRVVGGCYNSRVEFGGNAVALGGMPKKLAADAKDKAGNPTTNKVYLTIKNKFRPWRMLFDNATQTVRLVNDRTNKKGEYVPDDQVESDSTYYYREGVCNIFGGCFISGKTVGDIKLDIYSDVLGYYDSGKEWNKKDAQGRYLTVNREMMKGNVNIRRTAYSLIGAGYGPKTEVLGNVHLRLLPERTTDATTHHPSVLTIFGGSHDGKHVGNSTTEVRDGMVFSNLYGGSRAAYKYGSSEIVVGYPKYYKVKEGKGGKFMLNRADQYSYVAEAMKNNSADSTYVINSTKIYKARNHDGTEVIKQSVKYKAGDIVAANVYEQIADDDKATRFDIVVNVDDYNNADNFENVEVINPAALGSTWDNISINIGDNSQMNDPASKFYGGGGIYGGGHALNESSVSLSGKYTQMEYDADNNLDCSSSSADIGFGGNSTILVGDDPNGSHDHISIGTGHYVKLNLKVGEEDKIGAYLKGSEIMENGTGTGKFNFIHQASGTAEAGKEYYKMETSGGIYGDGARTFVHNFRAVDITGYGYCDYTPQSAKLINTFQRIDILSLNDCCLQVQGAQDYATNAIDNTYYSIARIGEIRMNSTLTGDIEQSVKDEDNLGNMSLAEKKSRNYMGFFKNVHYVGALYSNTDFGSTYRSNDGKLDANDATYREIKQGYIDRYENPAHADHGDETKFKPRNLGTAPNMVGINNGYTLKIQNAFTTPPSGSTSAETMLSYEPKDNIYYGPIVGVVEVKLLTVQADEGGGYIYAFNHHADKETLSRAAGDKTFLEDTGNFVFAARVSGQTEADANYIIDDCYPEGYYTKASHATDEEIHYWFVQGHKYFFNTTLTGYTYNKPIDFYLNNADALILLSGVNASNASTIKVESVTWRDHATEGYKSALKDNLNSEGTDSRDNYQLFLSIDSHTDRPYTTTDAGNAFVARIPNGNAPDIYGTGTGGTIQFNNSYSDKSETEKNTPLIGIRLQDTDTLNISPSFFEKHLSDEDFVVIKLKALESGDPDLGTAVYNEYTINLTIDYLQGPYINGKVTIENCALPGEYIYANTEGITMLMDNQLTVTGKKWYLYPKQKRSGENAFFWDKNEKLDVTNFIKNDEVGDVNRIQLPARYYQNDWQLDYVVIVNGQEFGLNNSPMDIPRLTVHNYHRMSTVAENIKLLKKNASDPDPEINGYHLDLDLVGGALVYIEDDYDFEIFTKYVNYCNSYRDKMPTADELPKGYTMADYKMDDGILYQRDKKGGTEHWARVMRAEVLPGYNRQGGVTGFKNDNTIFGYDDDADVPTQNVKNPSGAENIRFVLTNDVHTTKNCMPIGQFRGKLTGNGHVIFLREGYKDKNFITDNYGDIRYVGLVSAGGEDSDGIETAGIFNNYGVVENCFYYCYDYKGGVYEDNFKNTNDGKFIGSKYASLVQNIGHVVIGEDDKKVHWIGTVDNCYQNTDMAQANALSVHALDIHEKIEKGEIPEPRHPIRGVLRYRSSQSFHNGMIAYNLNQDYLKARWKSEDTDELVREKMDVSHFDDDGNYVSGDFLYNYYADGDYRFAYVYDPVEHPECIRLASNVEGWPNYKDMMGNGQSMHKQSEETSHDDTRWFEGLNREDIVQTDYNGQVIYDEKKETLANGTVVTRIVPHTGNQGYFPIYLHDAHGTLVGHSDFILFGQRITDDTKKRQYFPSSINKDNRIYRASGFYGSRTDYGFHFNRDAVALIPQLTAIDFTGSSDLKTADGKPQYHERWQFYVKNEGHNCTEHSYESDKYYSYETLPGQYEKDPVTNAWTFREHLPRHEADTLIQLIYYPPLLDLPDGDDVKNLHNLKSFRITTNDNIHDHSKITKNLLVYTPAPGTGANEFNEADNEKFFKQLHYTRMQNNSPDTEVEQNDIIGHHIVWTKHGDNAHFHSYGGLFHLVDLQDFNAPIEFVVADNDAESDVGGHAWIRRQPEFYSKRENETADENGFIISRKSWRSLCLPFTANRVYAMNSGDYYLKYNRGPITHFYGNDPETGLTHHDYWLRGMTAAQTDGCGKTDNVEELVTFVRPGNVGDEGLFHVQGKDLAGNPVDEQKIGDYFYQDSWFKNSYENYLDAHDDYTKGIEFKKYCYITKNAPYIIAFPGKGYYEFDLSGEFYNECNETNGCRPQEIMYEFTVDSIDKNNNFDVQSLAVRIPVTDLYDAVRHTTLTDNGGRTVAHHGTFARIAGNAVQDNMYVLNPKPIPAMKIHSDVANVDMLRAGSVFVRVKDMHELMEWDDWDEDSMEILPFRTYITIDAPAGEAPKKFIMIGNGGQRDDIGNPDDSDEPKEDDRPQFSGVNIFVKDNNLVITSDTDFRLPLYGISGQLFQILEVRAGYNVYRNMHSGVYIVRGKKFAIKR